MSISILQKIDELFRYRKFPEILKLVGEDYDQSQFILELKGLQLKIYELDQYLETHWEVVDDELDAFWQAIRESLNTCMTSKGDSEKYLSHIKKYQHHELQLREDKLPTRFKLSYFYFYKSCDVKLIRRLIYDRFPHLRKLMPESSWRAFDYITEIDDDVEDVYEDQETINANAYMISILTEGNEHANNQYRLFLDSQKTIIEQLEYPFVKELSHDVLILTKALLKERHDSFKASANIPKTVLEKYLKLR